MKRSRAMEFGVGLFILVGVLGMVFLGLRVSGLSFSGPSNTFQLDAHFSNIGGLKPRARVSMSGVTVGQVESIELDTEWYDARVTLVLIVSWKGRFHVMPLPQS